MFQAVSVSFYGAHRSNGALCVVRRDKTNECRTPEWESQWNSASKPRVATEEPFGERNFKTVVPFSPGLAGPRGSQLQRNPRRYRYVHSAVMLRKRARNSS
jgi:hypothetical protein